MLSIHQDACKRGDEKVSAIMSKSFIYCIKLHKFDLNILGSLPVIGTESTPTPFLPLTKYGPGKMFLLLFFFIFHQSWLIFVFQQPVEIKMSHYFH